MSRLESLMSFYHSDTEDPFNMYAIALEFRSLNQTEEAIQWLEKLRSKFPSYVPTYYQLAKLVEESNIEEAEKIYLEGMNAAQLANDNHAYKELKAALQMLLDDLL